MMLTVNKIIFTVSMSLLLCAAIVLIVYLVKSLFFDVKNVQRYGSYTSRSIDAYEYPAIREDALRYKRQQKEELEFMRLVDRTMRIESELRKTKELFKATINHYGGSVTIPYSAYQNLNEDAVLVRTDNTIDKTVTLTVKNGETK